MVLRKQGLCINLGKDAANEFICLSSKQRSRVSEIAKVETEGARDKAWRLVSEPHARFERTVTERGRAKEFATAARSRNRVTGSRRVAYSATCWTFWPAFLMPVPTS
jgi:hypothetical protein